MISRAAIFPAALALVLGLLAPEAYAKGKVKALKTDLVQETRDVSAMLQDCQATAAKRNDFSVPFSQETFSALRNRTTKQTGGLSFKPPRSFRWEVDEPRRELYVSNGKEFWKYNETSRHAQRMSVDLMELHFLDAVLRPGMLSSDFEIRPWVKDEPASEPTPTAVAGAPAAAVASAATPTAAPTPKPFNTTISELPPEKASGKILAKLLPKVKSKQTAMYIVVDKTRCFVDELRVFYENGNRNRILFGRVTEKPIPATSFDFVPPPGTAVDK